MEKEHGIKGTDLNFESKMSSLGNVVFIDRCIMDVVFLISLTHKKFFISPPPPHSCLFFVLWFVFFKRLIALTFAGHTCLMKFSVCIVLDFQSLIYRLCANTLGARDFSSAVSGLCQVFIVTRANSLWSRALLL